MIQMASPLFIILFHIVWISSFSLLTSAYQCESETSQTTERSAGKRHLLSFKETPQGSNLTFECSPSGPCVSCLYSEKNDEKYRCSETGYRIPLKCIEGEAASKDVNAQKTQKGDSGGKSQAYITYRSCIPAVNEEKLSVLGFEGIVFCLLLISGSFVYIRRKRSLAGSGAGSGRMQANSRF